MRPCTKCGGLLNNLCSVPGTGKMTCKGCKGTGFIKDKRGNERCCTTCNGTGKATCSSCGGSGMK